MSKFMLRAISSEAKTGPDIYVSEAGTKIGRNVPQPENRLPAGWTAVSGTHCEIYQEQVTCKTGQKIKTNLYRNFGKDLCQHFKPVLFVSAWN